VSSRRRPRAAVPAALGVHFAAALLAAGCGTVDLSQGAGAGGPSWPEKEPRVRFERSIQTRGDLSASGRRFSDWVAGSGDQPLFERPYGIAWDGDDLVVSDPGSRQVVRLAGSGAVTRSAAGEWDEPLGVAACPAGIVVSEPRAGRVVLATKELRASRVLAEGLSRPTGVACDGTSVFVAETGAHRVLVLSPSGGRRSVGRRGSGPGEFNFPTALHASQGALWVGDTLNSRLQRFDAASLRLLGAFGTLGDSSGEMPRLKGIARDAGGNLWVTDAVLDQVCLYDEEGAFLVAVGRTGSGPGEFSFPAGAAAHADGRIAVVDSLNRRIQIFRLTRAGGAPL
jgi:DNA-binding beta-propeller fold protein YncE